MSAEHADEQDTADATNDASHDIDDKKNDDVDDSNNGSDAQTDEAGDGTPIDMSSLFEIELAAPTSKTGTKKRRRGLPMLLQENTFDSSLNVMYAVKFNYGNGRWDAINKYTKFIRMSTTKLIRIATWLTVSCSWREARSGDIQDRRRGLCKSRGGRLLGGRSPRNTRT